MSQWDYRKLPETELLRRLKRCSEGATSKFARWLFTQRGTHDLVITENELYLHWAEFCEQSGIPNHRDCMFVSTEMECLLKAKRVDTELFFSAESIRGFVR